MVKDWKIFREIGSFVRYSQYPLRDAAQALMSAGFKVVPIDMTNGKKPLKHNEDGSAKFLTNTSWDDPWALNDIDGDPNRNLGIMTGGEFWVLDVDGPRGARSLELLCRWISGLAGTIRDTLMIKTGKGNHFYFARPVPNPDDVWKCGATTDMPTSIAVLPGIDVRGEKGMVVAPPSLHANGERYTVVETAGMFPRLAPDDLVELVQLAPEMVLQLPDAFRKAMAEKDDEAVARIVSKAGSPGANKAVAQSLL